MKNSTDASPFFVALLAILITYVLFNLALGVAIDPGNSGSFSSPY